MSNTQRKIVIVEDEEILANLLSMKLQKAGYLAEVYGDGASGLEAIRSGSPDLVLLDIMLPKKNGYEILEALNAEGIVPNLPVIVISNSGQKVELDRVKQLGARHSLVKVNFDPNEVLELVHDAFKDDEALEAPSSQQPETPAAEHPAEAPAAPADAKQYTVLVVEDDMFIADLEVRKLRETFNVRHATTTEQAKQILAEQLVDIICLDVLLPGEDGISYLKELKRDERTKHIPVVVFSNLGQEDEIKEGMSAGAEDYLIKANSMPEEIARRLMRILESKKA
jgi:DNA-binding response OmpR family regulator